MRPDEVRERIRADHGELRTLLRVVEDLARQAAGGETNAVADLRQQGLRLNERFGAHLDLEDMHLVPLLREGRGDDDAERLANEHREQRLLMDFLLERLRDTRRPAVLLVRELQTLVELLRDDMGQEEKELVDADDLWPKAP
jgi:hemerythrin-like domain-containing protein